jgi:hypothetical protein
METLNVNERRDDTTKPESESRPARGHGDYYYDDSTGYETYEPEEIEENEAEEDLTKKARVEEDAPPRVEE